MLSRSSITSLITRIEQSLPRTVPRQTPYLLPLLSATTLGHSHHFLSPCLAHAFKSLPPPLATSPIPKEPLDPRQDETLHPRRWTVRLIKESLVKSSILIGVPKTIETLLELDRLVDERDKSTAFVRRGMEEDGTLRDRRQAGRIGLEGIYQENLVPIFQTMNTQGLEDVRFFSESITYGTFLAPYSPPSPDPSSSTAITSSSSPDPFSSHPRLLSLLTLSTLIPQRTTREIHWHLRGALRKGWTREEVEAVQLAIEMVCRELEGERWSRDGRTLPRVRDVEVQKEEEESERQTKDLK